MKHRFVEFYRSDVDTNDRHGTPGGIEAFHEGEPIDLDVRDKSARTSRRRLTL
jgi:hypothetical protein